MTSHPTIARVHNLDGTLRFDLTPTLGFEHVGLAGPGSVLWRVGTIESRYVEGAVLDGPPVRTMQTRSERIKVLGDPAAVSDEAYWESVDDRIEALTDAVSTPFLWATSVGGKLWTYRTIGPADVDVSETSRNILSGGYRIAVLSFRVQPNPTKVPLGGGA